MDNWKIIWSKKNLELNSYKSLNNLIEANGFDTGFGNYTEVKWRELVYDFYKRANFNKNANVLELGCGSGAFLFTLNELVEANFYGLDYSPSLIQIAKNAIPNAHLVANEARSKAFSNIHFDVIFSHSVFQYFPNTQYAEDVITNWCIIMRECKLMKIQKNILICIKDLGIYFSIKHISKKFLKSVG